MNALPKWLRWIYTRNNSDCEGYIYYIMSARVLNTSHRFILKMVILW